MTKTSSNLVVGTTLLLALGVVAGHLFGDPFIALFNNYSKEEAVPIEQAVTNPLPGTFLVSMRPLSPDGARAGIYKISAASGEATAENEAGDFYAPTISNEGSKIAVVSSEGSDDALLFVGSITQPESAFGFAPPSPALRAGAASWSTDDAHIVYEAFTALPQKDDTSIENARIVLLDVDSKEQQIIDNGVSPIFASENSLLYLKADGLYRQVLATGTPEGEPTRVAFFDGYVATTDSQIALAPDRAHVIVTHPHLSLIISYDIYGSDEGIELVENSNYFRSVSWPVFSPDGNSLAFIDHDVDENNTTSKALMVIELSSGDVRVIKTLDDYDISYLSLRGWLE